MSDRENSEKRVEVAKETDTRTESTSMVDTEGQDTDLMTSESDARADWRHERDPRSSGEKRDNATHMRHELCQSSGHPVRTGVADCHYYLKYGCCFFGRSCRFIHPPRNQMGHDTMQPSAYQVRLGAPNCVQYLQTGQCSYGSKCWFNHPPLPERNLMRHEMLQPSPYPGARDCEQYLRTGQCSYGRKCRFNHPHTHLAPVLPESVSRPICKLFQRGSCEYGSGCKFTHSVRGDGVELMRQATTWVRRFDERRHGTESSSRAEQRWRTIPDSPERDPRKRFEDVVAGQNSWLQRRQARENVQRGNIDCGQRRERVRRKENLQEQADMERQKRERLKRKRSISLTDNVDQLRQFLQDTGIERKEDNGF